MKKLKINELLKVKQNLILNKIDGLMHLSNNNKKNRYTKIKWVKV